MLCVTCVTSIACAWLPVPVVNGFTMHTGTDELTPATAKDMHMDQFDNNMNHAAVSINATSRAAHHILFRVVHEVAHELISQPASQRC